MNKAIKLGIIGCGGHAQHHAQHLGDRFEVYSVTDIKPEAMEQIPSTKKSPTILDLLNEKDIEAVLIGTPDDCHLGELVASLNAGKHVFCEKPLIVPGQTIQELEQAFELAAKKKLVVSTCHPRRFDRPARWLAKHKEKLVKRLGAVIGFEFDFSYHKPWAAWKHGRSLLLDHLNHEVDLMNFLFGICGFRAWKLHDGFDRYEVVGNRDDNISFRFQGTRRLESETYPEWIRVRFERGLVEIDTMLGVGRITDHDGMTIEQFPNMRMDYDGRLEKVMNNFADQIEHGTPGYVSPAEMLMNTKVGLIMQNDGIQYIGKD